MIGDLNILPCAEVFKPNPQAGPAPAFCRPAIRSRGGATVPPTGCSVGVDPSAFLCRNLQVRVVLYA